MRVLIIGILIFLAWSSICTWYYTTRIFVPVDQTAQETDKEYIEQAAEPLTPAVEAITPSAPESFPVYFDFNRSDFSSDQNLQDFIEQCKVYLQSNPGSCLLITGYTDSKGTEDYNLDLGLRRAKSIREYLLRMGLSQSCIKISSRGEAQPIEDNASEIGRAKNRRAVLEIQQ